jgi:hypothetical protein
MKTYLLRFGELFISPIKKSGGVTFKNNMFIFIMFSNKPEAKHYFFVVARLICFINNTTHLNHLHAHITNITSFESVNLQGLDELAHQHKNVSVSVLERKTNQK